MTKININHDLIAFCHELADISGDVILSHFRQSTLAVENKAHAQNFDPVTHADREAERIIRHKIENVFPDHGIIGEEFGTKASRQNSPELSWILDPIDGTRAFMMGYPTWGTLIGLLQDDAPVLGMMNQPFTQERYWSYTTESQKKTYYQGADKVVHTLQTRPDTTLSQALLASTHPDLFAELDEKQCFQELSRHVRLVRYGGDCYSYCQLAFGHIDLVVEAGLQSYDIAPLIPIIEGAGGIITCWDGTPANNGGRIIAAANQNVYKQALEILN